jgi:glycosyltransferase involved in cell wall biosynthesis
MNKKSPFFSIIIPIYNSQINLYECLNSIIIQNYKNFEILLIDCLSTDNSLIIASSFNDKRIRIFSEKDNGIYDAMNKGINLSKGKWLYFLGSDDKLFDFSILNSVAELDYAFNCNFIYGNVIFNNSRTIYDGLFSREKLVSEKNICHQSIFYNKILFDNLGRYNLNFKILADWDFNIRCFSYPDIKIKYIDLIIAFYEDISGISKSNKEEINFTKLLPYYYISQNKLVNTELTIGKYIFIPFRIIKIFFKKCFTSNILF